MLLIEETVTGTSPAVGRQSTQDSSILCPLSKAKFPYEEDNLVAQNLFSAILTEVSELTTFPARSSSPFTCLFNAFTLKMGTGKGDEKGTCKSTCC